MEVLEVNYLEVLQKCGAVLLAFGARACDEAVRPSLVVRPWRIRLRPLQPQWWRQLRQVLNMLFQLPQALLVMLLWWCLTLFEMLVYSQVKYHLQVLHLPQPLLPRLSHYVEGVLRGLDLVMAKCAEIAAQSRDVGLCPGDPGECLLLLPRPGDIAEPEAAPVAAPASTVAQLDRVLAL